MLQIGACDSQWMNVTLIPILLRISLIVEFILVTPMLLVQRLVLRIQDNLDQRLETTSSTFVVLISMRSTFVLFVLAYQKIHYSELIFQGVGENPLVGQPTRV